MTMKDSEDARKMEDLTDTMIISVMEEMKALVLPNNDITGEVSESTSDAEVDPSDLQEMKCVLIFYDGIIEQLWKIAENIAKTSAAEEQHAGTVFMGSSGDGTYLPELSAEFNTYVMEEDSQYEMQEDLEAMDTDFENKNPDDHACLLKVCCLLVISLLRWSLDDRSTSKQRFAFSLHSRGGGGGWGWFSPKFYTGRLSPRFKSIPFYIYTNS